MSRTIIKLSSENTLSISCFLYKIACTLNITVTPLNVWKEKNHWNRMHTQISKCEWERKNSKKNVHNNNEHSGVKERVQKEL